MRRSTRLLAFIIMLVAPVVWAEDALDSTAPEVDEQLYLVTTLRYAYDSWPKDIADGSAFAQQLDQIRFNAVRYREYIREKGLDAKLVSLYDDLVNTVDAQKDYMVKAGIIRADVKQREGAAARNLAGSLLEACLTHGVGVMAVVGALNDVAKINQMNQEARQSIANAHREVEKQLSNASARAEAVCLVLGEKHQWRRGETGFSNRDEESERTRALAEAVAATTQPMAQQGDAKAKRQELSRWLVSLAKKRPRDPIMALWYYELKTADFQDNPGELYQVARDCAGAAKLVPASELFDEDRGRILYTAAVVATVSAGVERAQADHVSTAGSIEKARFAVRAFDAANDRFAMEVIDKDGGIRLIRAAALRFIGDYEGALTQAQELEPLLKADATYDYFIALLYGKLGKQDDCLKWFELAIRSGAFTDIQKTRVEPDLADFRRVKASEFQQLTKVEWYAEIKQSWNGSGSITLTNKSPFTITNVSVTPHIQLHNDNELSAKPLTVGQVLPGKTYTWANAVSIPQVSFEKWNADFTCDQDPREPPGVLASIARAIANVGKSNH